MAVESDQPAVERPTRTPTRTSAFGVGRRESHDASPFYDRFAPPVISEDDEVAPPTATDRIWVGDARDMDTHGEIADNSVALVVTSPPYFAGKEYEQALGQGVTPASYLDYLSMLEAVFAECARKLEPGGRIAVNVANLGRKPYRSLSSDVIGIFERLGLLLRGEVIWRKAVGAGGSCAWGTFQRPGNPVLRDLTERVVIASKGRFDRAVSARRRHEEDLPSQGSMFADDFLEATTDVWEMSPESASRVNHPAPFPVDLPHRLIDLYTYRGDLVLDPFMGSGSTAVAAVRTERHYVGFDTEADYVTQADERVAAERARLDGPEVAEAPRVVVPAIPGTEPEPLGEGAFQARAVREGKKAKDLARSVLEDAGFDRITADVKFAPLGVEVNFMAVDGRDEPWQFDVSGAFTNSGRPGLRRTDTLWKALGKAAVLQQARREQRDDDTSAELILLTTHKPGERSAGSKALDGLVGPGKPIRDVIGMLDDDDLRRLAAFGRGERPERQPSLRAGR